MGFPLFLKPRSAHHTSTGSVAVSPNFKVAFGKMYSNFPMAIMQFFRINVWFCPYFWCIWATFLCLWKIDDIGFQSLFRGQHCKKNRSYEYRHQSDTVCHNIFDSYGCESTRNPVNIPEIDKRMPYHQTSGSSIVEAYDTKRGTDDPLTKSN